MAKKTEGEGVVGETGMIAGSERARIAFLEFADLNTLRDKLNEVIARIN